MADIFRMHLDDIVESSALEFPEIILRELYYRSKAEKIEGEVCDEILPYSEVIRDDLVYRIHGIVHGYDDWLLGLRKRVKKAFKERIEGFIKEGVCFFEQRLGSVLFGYPKEYELGDLEVIGLRPYKGRKAAHFILSTFFYCFMKLWSNFDEKARILMGALKSTEGQARARAWMHAMKLPEPLDMELQIYEALKYPLFDSKDPVGQVLSIFRSAFMASEAVRRVSEGKGVIHLIVGLEHETQITYFLKQQEIGEAFKDILRRAQRAYALSLDRLIDKLKI